MINIHLWSSMINRLFIDYWENQWWWYSTTHYNHWLALMIDLRWSSICISSRILINIYIDQIWSWVPLIIDGSNIINTVYGDQYTIIDDQSSMVNIYFEKTFKCIIICPIDVSWVSSRQMPYHQFTNLSNY